MNNVLTIAPLLLPMLSGVLLLSIKQNIKLSTAVYLVSSILQFIVSSILLFTISESKFFVMHIGGWEAPFGITIAIDIAGSIMLVAGSFVSLAVALFAVNTVEPRRLQFGFYGLTQFLIIGVNGAFITGDIFNLFVWFEVMLISSFVLLSLGAGKEQLEGTIKYVLLNLVSSAFFLMGVGILYSATGSLNFAKIASVAILNPDNSLLTLSTAFFIFSFGMKAAIFPVFFWLPSSYHTPPIVVTALFSGLLTKVGVFSLIRLFTYVLPTQQQEFSFLLKVLAGFTMVIGVLGAIAQNDVRRLLSFHIISQIGYMIMGIAIGTAASFAATIFYIVHNMLAKTNLFFAAGIQNQILGTYNLKKSGGLYKTVPYLSLLFIISAFALAGFPPLSGFPAKLTLISSGFSAGEYLISGVAIMVSFFTLFSMVKIWNEAYWKELIPERSAGSKTNKMMYLPVILMALAIIGTGVFFQPIYHLLMMAAHQLSTPELYINAVLGEV